MVHESVDGVPVMVHGNEVPVMAHGSMDGVPVMVRGSVDGVKKLDLACEPESTCFPETLTSSMALLVKASVVRDRVCLLTSSCPDGVRSPFPFELIFPPKKSGRFRLKKLLQQRLLGSRSTLDQCGFDALTLNLLRSHFRLIRVRKSDAGTGTGK